MSDRALAPFLDPATVTVIGASRDPFKVGGSVGRFSQLLVDLPELGEIEINPLTVGPDGAVAVDARARLSR